MQNALMLTISPETYGYSRASRTDVIPVIRPVGHFPINSSKTKILTNQCTDQEISEFFPGTDDRSNSIDNMWRSRSRRVISRSVKYISEII